MKKNCHILIIMLVISRPSLLISTGFGMETNVSGSDKNKTNIYGNLETWGSDAAGRPIKLAIDNISLGGLFNDVPVYATPPAKDYDTATRALTVDPTIKYLKVDMHLIDKNDKPKIVEIRVDNPDIVWTYKNPNRSYPEKVEYIEMTFKACDGTERNYLIDTKKKLICYQTKPPAERMEIPLAGIKKLTIDGAKPREDKESCACDVTPACAVKKESEPDPIEEEPSATRVNAPATIKMPITSGLTSGGAHFAPGAHAGK